MDPAAKRHGHEAEERAARHLHGIGYEILARNLRTKSGEIDIVARDGRILVIVEVKYRSAHIYAAWQSLTARKRQILVHTAREAMAVLRIPRGAPVRFDVVLMSSDGALAHKRGALPASRPYDP